MKSFRKQCLNTSQNHQNHLKRLENNPNHENISIKNENFLKELMKLRTNKLISIESHLKAKEINKFLNQISSSQKKALSRIIVRKMQKANYSTKSLGHYGLGLKSYAHFTSPIRRYSDIVAHRMIKGKFNANNDIFSVILQCNIGELRSQNAERGYMILKGLKLLEHLKDESLNGYVTKIQRSKMIVNEKVSGVDGIILKKSFPKGFYEFHKDMLYIRNKIGPEKFRVGDEVSIKVSFIDFISQTVHFTFKV